MTDIEKKPRQSLKNMTVEEKREYRRVKMQNYRDTHREAYRAQRTEYIKKYRARPEFKEQHRTYMGRYNKKIHEQARLFREQMDKKECSLGINNDLEKK